MFRLASCLGGCSGRRGRRVCRGLPGPLRQLVLRPNDELRPCSRRAQRAVLSRWIQVRVGHRAGPVRHGGCDLSRAPWFRRGRRGCAPCRWPACIVLLGLYVAAGCLPARLAWVRPLHDADVAARSGLYPDQPGLEVYTVVEQAGELKGASEGSDGASGQQCAGVGPQRYQES